MDDTLESRSRSNGKESEVEKRAAEMLLESTRPVLTTSSVIALSHKSSGAASEVLADLNAGMISGLNESATDPLGHMVRVGLTSAVAWRAASNQNLSPFRSVAGRVIGAAVAATICTRLAEQFSPGPDMTITDRSSVEAFAHEATRFAADVAVAGGLGVALGRSRWLAEGERLIDNIIEREQTIVFTGAARSYCRGGKLRTSRGYYYVNESANSKAMDIVKTLEWREQPHLIPKAFDSLKVAKPDWKLVQ